MNTDQLKNLLQRYGLKPNFTYGQNFLIDDIVMEDIVDAAEVAKDDCVLEIGPGIGNLTRRLCERAGFVLSVEKDPKFQPILKSIKKDHKNFQWEIADALEYDFQSFFLSNSGVIPSAPEESLKRGLPMKQSKRDSSSTFAKASADKSDGLLGMTHVKYKVVANIPYYITGKILQMFMTAKFKPSSITVLTQKEVARNVAAKAGDLSLLAISVQLYGDPKFIRMVPARSFHPAPKVDSAILRIDLHAKPKYDVGDEKKFFGVLRACFAGKRKQIHNTLKNNLKLSAEQVGKILSEAKINPAARPQELSIEQWVKLVNEMKNAE